MLIRFDALLAARLVRGMAPKLFLTLVLALLLPCAIDGHNHDPLSVESAQVHAASCLDVISAGTLVAKVEVSGGPARVVQPSNRFPTRRFLITLTSSSAF